MNYGVFRSFVEDEDEEGVINILENLESRSEVWEVKIEQLENMIHVYEEHIDVLEKENKQLKAQVDFLKEQLAYKTFGKPLDLEE